MLSNDWAGISVSASGDEKLAFNTHINTRAGMNQFPEKEQLTEREKSERRGVKWVDEKGQSEEVKTIIGDLEMEKCVNPRDLKPVTVHREATDVKPIYKPRPGPVNYTLNYSSSTSHFNSEKFVADGGLLAQSQPPNNLVGTYTEGKEPMNIPNEEPDFERDLPNPNDPNEEEKLTAREENEAVPVASNFRQKAPQKQIGR